VITLDASNTVTLVGTLLANVTQSDFSFIPEIGRPRISRDPPRLACSKLVGRLPRPCDRNQAPLPTVSVGALGGLDRAAEFISAFWLVAARLRCR
jgi:hypothetical protein